MPVPSSGGIAVGEVLNLLEAYDARPAPLSDVSNASTCTGSRRPPPRPSPTATAGSVTSPACRSRQLLSQGFADERACLFDPTAAQPRPIPFGSPDGSLRGVPRGRRRQGEPDEGHVTTHLVAADRWGNVASYTLTIEQTGGSGITVPGYGFLLNNELTDFNFVPLTAGVPDPNLPGPGKRPRSSMSPTIVLKDGKPWLAVGSPGGATIITTVAADLLGYLDRGLSLVDAIAAARLSSRNGAARARSRRSSTGPTATRLPALGHNLVSAGTPNEIGAVDGDPPARWQPFEAAAETTRRGGGSAMVVRPVAVTRQPG